MRSKSLCALAAAVAAALALAGLSVGSRGEAQFAQRPCNSSNWQNDADEVELSILLNDWRASVLGAPAMELSGPVNRAAQWFANETAAGTTSGHWDQYGRNWVQRLVDCGYPTSFAYGSGESLGVGSSAASALGSMATPDDNHQSGIEAPVAWACVGIGRSGSVWVVVVAQNFESCPEPGTSSPPEPTATPTNTPAPTATPTPPAVANYGFSIQICPGWNLVTVPVSGPIDDVFDTAESSLSAIYRQNGDGWERWAPGVPAYARNLSYAVAGDVLWVYGTTAACEELAL